MLAADEIARELERQLQEATSKIETFVTNQIASLTKAQHDHEQLMRDMEAKIQRLKMEEVDAGSKRAVLSGQLAADKKQAQEKQAELSTLERQKGNLPAEVEAAQVKVEAATQQLQQTRAEYERKEGEVRYQLQELTKGIEFYKRLGLSFEKITEDNLRIVLTQIDHANPGRRFTFTVRMSADERYDVVECDPPVAALQQMLAQLNADNDFSKFVQLMRREFKALV